MKTLSLKEWFSEVNYDWTKDQDAINKICKYTKTRVNPKLVGSNKLTWGTEQTFLIKSVAEWAGTKRFFEIGTGRGTACYALAMIPAIENIHTVDILNFKQKFATAIDHKPATVLLLDIRNMIPFSEKSKVNFHHRSELNGMRKSYAKYFDLCFIDGDHSNKAVILDDYAACVDMLSDNGIILWDDYDPERFVVKEVIEEIMRSDPELEAVLVEQRGHLFNEKPQEHNKGVVIMRRGKVI